MEENAQPLVSIGIPVYGVAKWIERCARSLFEQTYQNIEYVFVDDCSPDNSIEILQNVITRYPDRQKHIKIIRHNVNKGLASARNTFLDNMTGPFCMHVDSDDYVEKTYVEEMVKAQQTNDADIVLCDYRQEYKTNYRYHRVADYASARDFSMRIVYEKGFQIWGKLIRSCLYTQNKIKLIDGANMAEDYYQTNMLAFYAKKIAILHRPLYVYNSINDNSMSASRDPKKENDVLINRKALHSFLETKDTGYLKSIKLSNIEFCISQMFAGEISNENIRFLQENRQYKNEFPFSRKIFFGTRKKVLLKLYVKTYWFIYKTLYKN